MRALLHLKSVNYIMKNIRLWHSYLGLFIAPSVLFFSLTGAVQLFSLHEAHGGYQPFGFIKKLSSVHKDQVFSHGERHPPPPSVGDAATPSVDAPPPDDDEDEVSAATWILKGFFLLVTLSLALSTAFGLWMGLTQTRRKRTAWSLLFAGALLPAILLLF